MQYVHHRVSFRSIGAQLKGPDHRMTSYNRALEITRCESIETTLRTRRLFWAGTLILMSGGGCQSKSCSATLRVQCGEDGVGKKKEWTDCVQSDIRVFGIAGDWKATALKAEVWAETVTEGGRRFMAAWRKEEVEPDIARKRERQRDWESCYRTQKRRILRSDTHWPSR